MPIDIYSVLLFETPSFLRSKKFSHIIAIAPCESDSSIDCQVVKSTVNIDYFNKCKEHLTRTLVHDGHS